MSEPRPRAKEVVELLVAQAPALRKAGVVELELDCFKVRLAPHVEEPAEQHDQVTAGSFADPALYGLPDGAEVPGFAALRDRYRRKSET